MKDIRNIEIKKLRLIISGLVNYSGFFDFKSESYKKLYEVIKELEIIESERLDKIREKDKYLEKFFPERFR